MQGAQLRVDSQSAAADGCTTVIPTSKKFPVFRKNNSPLHPPMWKKEATSYYFFFIKLPWPKDHGQKLLASSTIANEGMEVLVEN